MNAADPLRVPAIVYEVSVFVQRAIESEYRAWLDAHVREIMRLLGFVDASVFECLEPVANSDGFGLCVHYRLSDEAALAAYLRDHAPRLRAAGNTRFGTGFRAERRILRTCTNYWASPPAITAA